MILQWPGDSPVVLHACRYYKIPKRLLEEASAEVCTCTCMQPAGPTFMA